MEFKFEKTLINFINVNHNNGRKQHMVIMCYIIENYQLEIL